MNWNRFDAADYAGLPPSPRRRRAVRFVPNQEVRVRLRWDGRIVSRDGAERAVYELADGRVMYVPLSVATSIRSLEIRPGEEFSICKRWNGAHSQPARWDVWRPGNLRVQGWPVIGARVRDL